MYAKGEGEGRRGEDKTLLDNGCIIMKRIQLGEARGGEGTARNRREAATASKQTPP